MKISGENEISGEGEISGEEKEDNKSDVNEEDNEELTFEDKVNKLNQSLMFNDNNVEDIVINQDNKYSDLSIQDLKSRGDRELQLPIREIKLH